MHDKEFRKLLEQFHEDMVQGRDKVSHVCLGYLKDELVKKTLEFNGTFIRLCQCQSNIFSTFLSKITNYNQVHLVGDPAFIRMLGHDPTPRPTCPVDELVRNVKIAEPVYLCIQFNHNGSNAYAL